MRRALGIACIGLGLAAPARAQAQLPLVLDWQAPPECGSAADVRAELERIAHVVPGHALPPLRARARVERQASGYTLLLTTEHEGERGVRRLEAGDCTTLARSLTLVLALAFGKGVEISSAAGDRASTPPAPAPAPSGRAAEDAGDADTDADADADDSAGRLRISLLLGAGVQLGLMPGPAALGTLGVELSGAMWSGALRAGVWPESSAALGGGLDARFDGVSGELQGCAQLPAATFALGLCGRAVAAAVRGRSEGAYEDGSDTAPWLAFGAAAALSWPRGSALRVRLEAAFDATLARHRFVVESFGTAHRMPQLAPRIGALLVVTP